MRTETWIFYFLLWTAVGANEGPLHRKTGDTAVLTPESVVTSIYSIRWKHGPDIAMEWFGGETLSYRQFKDRGSLNISTGVMTITGLTGDDSGIYTVEINNRETSKTQLLVISPVPKPTISASCDNEKTYCVFTCDGDTTGAEPVTYWWTAGEKRWSSTNQHTITKEDEEQWITCALENRVSSSSSEEVFNPLMKSDTAWKLMLTSVAVGILVCSLIIIICLIRIKIRKDAVDCAEQGKVAVDETEPAAEIQMEEGWSTTLIPTTDEEQIYSVTKDSVRSRVALLITNIEFKDEELNRRGAERDEENMETLLTKLGYEVVKYTNLTGKEIEEAVIKFSKHPKLTETDSVFVVIMSHGEQGTVIGVRGKPSKKQDNFPIDNIYKHLDTEHCPALLNKPKIIIIETDRGVDRPDIEDYCSRRVHIEKDFISFFSCTPGTVSYRHPENGSLFIQFIVGVLKTFAHQDHIEELFRKVIQCFEGKERTLRLMPTKDRCTLSKKFYLFPKNL